MPGYYHVTRRNGTTEALCEECLSWERQDIRACHTLEQKKAHPFWGITHEYREAVPDGLRCAGCQGVLVSRRVTA